MSRPDNAVARRARSSRARRSLSLLLFVLGTVVLLSAATPAMAQVGYAGVPSAPPPSDVYVGDAYVSPYAGGSTGVAAPRGVGDRSPGAPASGAAAAVSVRDPALTDRPPDVVRGDGRLVTGWDVVSLTALGLVAVAGLSASAGRWRSR